MHIAIKRNDGGVSFLTIYGDAEPQAEVDKWKATFPQLGYASHREIASLPVDRTFRDAFTDTGTSIDVDMNKAREIAKGETEDVVHASIDAATSPEDLKTILQSQE